MNSQEKPIEKLVGELQERAKELNCLYRVEELLKNASDNLDALFKGIIKIMPAGWQYPELCQVKIALDEKIYQSPNYKATPWQQQTSIVVQNKACGEITVSYKELPPLSQDGYFLSEETKLINTIAERISHTLQYLQYRKVFNDWQSMGKRTLEGKGKDWRMIIDLLIRSDRKLYFYLSQKMLYYLSWKGTKEAEYLLQRMSETKKNSLVEEPFDCNRPLQKQSMEKLMAISEEIFKIAEDTLNTDLILSLTQKWIEEDKSRFLVRIIDDSQSSLSSIIDAITRYHYLSREGFTLPQSIEKGINVSLIRRFFSARLGFINIAKNHIEVKDFYPLIKRIIYPANSHGKLGGKSTGLFMATQIIKKHAEEMPLLKEVKIPKTWYITSDTLKNFLFYNNLEEITEQKYKETDEIQLEYPNVVQILKNSPFPPEIEKGLRAALEEFRDLPIIVRSSSLLEDSVGAAFSGKYKSLFLANQGDKEQKLEDLKDAIAEVYASTFASDPIEYRKERGLLDFHEEMGIMIQEVVGSRVGDYFLPLSAGVAFSKNEFRWSARIQRNDGLIRLVPGLGTRAVDRVSNDYPILICPGKPDLQVNITVDEIIRYSPQMIDVIDLKTNTFTTIEIAQLFKDHGQEIKNLHHMVSICRDNQLVQPSSAFAINLHSDDLVITFNGLIKNTDFVEQIRLLLNLLEEKTGWAVDIEFACDGNNLFLLQCRPQSYSKDSLPAPIPKDIKQDQILFTANRYISNGQVPDITHIVYIDATAYTQISSLSQLQRVGRAVGQLNKILPKKQFLLMGPGRWGSRGDIKLGVNVTYSDINNTAALVEIAWKKGNYVPELSFGTHFFQDLVEASIRYIPLYPGDDHVIFNEFYFNSSKNILGSIAPEFKDLEGVLRVIDVREQSQGKILRILMNADLDEAVAMLHSEEKKAVSTEETMAITPATPEEYWRWRLYMVEKIADRLDPQRFGVENLYVFGSTKNATAGPQSDIDLLVHFRGNKKQREELLWWLEGWSLTLSELNYLKTGYKTDGLLDIHIVTDKDIANKTSFAVKINAITDAAKPLPLRMKK